MKAGVFEVIESLMYCERMSRVSFRVSHPVAMLRVLIHEPRDGLSLL